MTISGTATVNKCLTSDCGLLCCDTMFSCGWMLHLSSRMNNHFQVGQETDHV